MRNKRENGITLIALVITIVLLIILAAIVINIIIDDNGILNMAKKAKDKYEVEENKESVGLASYESLMNDALARLNGTRDISEEQLEATINRLIETKMVNYVTNESLSNYATTEDLNNLADGESEDFVFETGDNYYCKRYSNGVIELTGKTSELTLTTSSTAWGGLYNAPTQTITFPITFTSIQSINLTSIASNGTSYTNISWHTLTNNSVKCEMWRPDKNITFNTTIYYTILGE